MKHLKVRTSLLWTLFVAVLAVVLFFYVETAAADQSNIVAAPDGYVVNTGDGPAFDGSEVAGTNKMCSIQTYFKGDAIEMHPDNTMILPPKVCEEIIGYIMIVISTKELQQQENY